MKILQPGRKVIVQTITYIYSGEVLCCDDETVTLVKCAWIADTGRAHQFYADPSTATEVELFPADAHVEINMQMVLATYEAASLPGEQS